MKDLEKDKFEERMDFAIDLLKKKFPKITESELIHEATEIAKTLYVRSEIQYNIRS